MIGVVALQTARKQDQAGPPFAVTSAENGASVDPVSGAIVLGNDVGGTLATLLSNRVIPMSGFNILLDGGAGGGVRLNPTNVQVGSANQIAFRSTNVAGTVVGDMAIDLNSLGLAFFVGSTSRGMFIWNNSNPFRGNVRFGNLPTSTAQDNGSLVQVDGPITHDRYVSPQNANRVVSNSLDKGKVFTNEGAGAGITFTLPGAAVSNINGGLFYVFYVQNANGIVIQAAAGDTIRVGATVSLAGGTISSATVGSSVTLQAINATEWVATALVGVFATP